MAKSKKKTSPYSTVRVDRSLRDDIDYWQKKCGFNSNKDFVDAAIRFYIAYKSGDYQLPNAETQRLNQIINGLNALTKQANVLTSTVNNGFSTILRLSNDDEES